jgi:hypothetical protein
LKILKILINYYVLLLIDLEEYYNRFDILTSIDLQVIVVTDHKSKDLIMMLFLIMKVLVLINKFYDA